jgi:hypothetical protein
MNREREHEDPIDLGAASTETKGAWDVDDHRVSLMPYEGGLTPD